MRRFLLAGALASALSVTALSGANATIAFKGSADLGNNLANPSSTYSATYTVNSASNMLHVLANNNNGTDVITGVSWNGAQMTLACKATNGNSAGFIYSFYLMNPATGSHTVAVTTNGTITGIQVLAADYSGVGSFESCKSDVPVSSTPTTSATISVGIGHVNDWVVVDTYGYTTQGAGAGATLRVNDAIYNEIGLFDSNGGLTIGSHSFTTTLSTANALGQIALAFTPANPGPLPTALNCVPASPSLPDSTGNGATVCAITVTMSDGSTYVGSNSVTPTSIFAVPATGNGNLTLARALTSADDGNLTAAVTASYNNGYISKNIVLTVTPQTSTGTPFAMGWKNSDPGAVSTNPACPSPSSFSCDGHAIFTAPHAYTINEITMRTTVPASGTAFVDVYKAASGTPCAAGTKLHAGDFNAAGAADQVQVLPLVADTGVTGNTTNASTTISSLSSNVILRGWQTGDAISGAGIPANDTIASIAAGGLSLTLVSAATATASGVALTVPTPVAVGDSVCVVTSQPFPNGQASVTVTAQ